VDRATTRLLRERAPEAGHGTDPDSTYAASERLIALRQALDEQRPGRARRPPGSMIVTSAVPGSAAIRTGTRAGVRRPGDLVERALGIAAAPVELVQEEERRDAEPLERAIEQRRLRLDALDRRDDEDRAVEDAAGRARPPR
jgi:hypothetical protein